MKTKENNGNTQAQPVAKPAQPAQERTLSQAGSTLHVRVVTIPESIKQSISQALSIGAAVIQKPR